MSVVKSKAERLGELFDKAYGYLPSPSSFEDVGGSMVVRCRTYSPMNSGAHKETEFQIDCVEMFMEQQDAEEIVATIPKNHVFHGVRCDYDEEDADPKIYVESTPSRMFLEYTISCGDKLQQVALLYTTLKYLESLLIGDKALYCYEYFKDGEISGVEIMEYLVEEGAANIGRDGKYLLGEEWRAISNVLSFAKWDKL